MFKLRVKLCLLFALFGFANCDKKLIKTLHFSPDSSVQIQAKMATSKPSGLTICFRMSSGKWDVKFLFEITSKRRSEIFFSLSDYRNNLGTFYDHRFNFANEFSFKYVDLIQLYPTAWNLICISLDPTTKTLYIGINGHQALNQTIISTLQDFTKDFSNSTVSIGDGRMSDFNFWNRPLSNEEMKNFLKCNSEVFQQNKPEYILWSEANITNQVGNVTSLMESVENVCQSEERKTNLMFQSKNYLRVCDRLNGKVLYVEDETDFEKELGASYLPVWCSYFWLPFVRSSSNPQKYYNPITKAEITFDGTSNKTSEGKDCVVYDIIEKKTKQISCEMNE